MKQNSSVAQAYLENMGTAKNRAQTILTQTEAQESVSSVRVTLKLSTWCWWIAQSTTTRRTQCEQRYTSPTKKGKTVAKNFR